MIFAPLSCPSSPGLAMTTRIFLGTVGQYMEVRLTVIGSSPAWPNPGSAQSGYLLEGPGRLLLDCGPGVLGRLRENGASIDAVAITHFHLDHWGDLVPWAWLNAYGPTEEKIPSTVWLPPGGVRELEAFAEKWGNENMFQGAFHLEEFEPAVPFEAAGFEVEAQRLPHYTMEAYGFRVREPERGRVVAYSGDSAPTPELAALARGADLFVCEATLSDGSRDGTPRGHLSVDEALAAADGRVLLTHRPVELPSPDGVQLAYDGLVVDV
jgi:ribonuclease BN (tRNA processing enzyme)